MQRTATSSATRQLQHRLHMPCAKLPVARLDVFDDPAHDALAQRFCLLWLLCALCVLGVKFFSFPRLKQIVDADSCSFTALVNQRTHAFFRDGVQEGLVFSREVRKSPEMFNDCRLKLFLEQGQKLFSNPRAHPLRVTVGGVFTPGLFSSAQKTPELTPANAQQRPDDRTGDGMNSAKPREACPAEEMREYRLCLIVGSVCHRDSPAHSRFRQ